MESEERKKMTSFSYSVEDDDRLKLIDISSEDDFLIASPLFDSLEDLRLSVTWDKNGENDCFRFSGIGNSCCNALPQSGRPSFLRRSLAWDNAFSTSSGVLDPDELSFINKGLCPKPESKQNVAPRRTVNGNMNKIKAVSKRDQHGNIQGSSEDKSNKKKTPLPGQSKSAFGSSCSSSRFSSSTSTIFSSSDSSFTSKDSIPYLRRSSSTRTLLKTRPGSRKNTVPQYNQILEVPDSSQVIGAAMDGTPKRDVVKPQEAAEIPISGSSKPSCLRLPSPKIGFFDEVAPKARGFFKFQIGKASKSSKEDAGRTPSGNGKQKLKASSTPQQPRSAPPFRLTASSLFSAHKSGEMDRETFCKSRKVGTGERERRSAGINNAPSTKGEQRKGRKEREERKKRKGGESSIMEKNGANDLSRRFKMMGLGEEEEEEETATRTPLAEKTATSLSNGNVTEPKKEKMVEKKKSPVFLFPSSDKENI